MHKLNIEQNSEVWIEFRKYKVGGSKVKNLKPLSRGKYKGIAEGAAGFWKLVSERLSLPKTGEDDRARGHRLEELALQKTNAKYSINLVQGSVWQSDENERLYISPDGEEPINVPTYAQETKALDSDKHLRIIWDDVQAKKNKVYKAFDSVPDEYRDQVVHYFSINDKLQTLYFTLINDLVAYEAMEHYCIIVDRSEVVEEIESHKEIERQVIIRSDQIVKELVSEFKEG